MTNIECLATIMISEKISLEQIIVKPMTQLFL